MVDICRGRYRGSLCGAAKQHIFGAKSFWRTALKVTGKLPLVGMFCADQGQKSRKSAPGEHVLGLTRGKNPAKMPLVF